MTYLALFPNASSARISNWYAEPYWVRFAENCLFASLAERVPFRRICSKKRWKPQATPPAISSGVYEGGHSGPPPIVLDESSGRLAIFSVRDSLSTAFFFFECFHSGNHLALENSRAALQP